LYIIKSDAGQPLREELARSPQKIIASAFPEFMPKAEPSTVSGSAATPLGDEGMAAAPEGSCVTSTSGGSSSDAYFQGLALVKTLVKLMPSWLQNNRTLFDTLVLVWKSPARIARLHKEQELNLVQVSCLLRENTGVCVFPGIPGLSSLSTF